MRGGTVQINWHDLQPVLSLDFHPATSGADHDVKVRPLPPLLSLPILAHFVTLSGPQIWTVASDGPNERLPTATFHSGLAPNGTAHNSAVNVIRFSPSGDPPSRATILVSLIPDIMSTFLFMFFPHINEV
jgi:chromatin assembly factor 1 subunit B